MPATPAAAPPEPLPPPPPPGRQEEATPPQQLWWGACMAAQEQHQQLHQASQTPADKRPPGALAHAVAVQGGVQAACSQALAERQQEEATPPQQPWRGAYLAAQEQHQQLHQKFEALAEELSPQTLINLAKAQMQLQAAYDAALAEHQQAAQAPWQAAPQPADGGAAPLPPAARISTVGALNAAASLDFIRF